LLRELQLQMLDALYDGRAARGAALIDAPKPEARARYHIYRNTVRSNFSEALRSTYPVICRLVGEPYFRQIAHAFRLSHPSTSGDLQQCGERFARYLAGLHGADDYAYLADVARLEWLIQEAVLAADHQSLDLNKLASLDTAQYEVLQFTLHPALRLFSSRYPVLKIWQANTNSDIDPEPIALNFGADRVVLIRHACRLRFHRMSAGKYGFLLALEKGAAFLAAVDAALRGDPDFDAAATLQHCVSMSAIVDFKLANSD
jgi:uncharacterized protein